MKGERSNPRVWIPPVPTKDELQTIHEAAIKIAGKVGVGKLTPDLLKIYKDAGCEVDENEMAAKIPEKLIMECIRKVPGSYLRAARNPENDVVSDAGKKQNLCGFGGGTMKRLWDEEKNEWVFSETTSDDVIRWQKILDYFPVVGPLFIPQELSKVGLPSDVHECNLVLRNTNNHFWHGDAIGNVEYYARLAAEVVGGLDELRKRPIISTHNAIFGLELGPGICGNIIGSAQYGLPSNANCLGFLGLSFPIYKAGGAAMSLSGNFALLVAHELALPGQPLYIGGAASEFDMFTNRMVYAGPGIGSSFAINVKIWHELYHHPLNAMGGCTYSDSYSMDIQHGMEMMISLFSAMAMGADEVWMMGGTPEYTAPVLIPIMAEMVKYCEHYLKGIFDFDVSPEKLMLDTMLKKDYKASYATEETTMKDMLIHYYPSEHGYGLADRRSFDVWMEDKTSMLDRANALLKKRLETYEIPQLPKDVLERMDAIVKEADEKLGI